MSIPLHIELAAQEIARKAGFRQIIGITCSAENIERVKASCRETGCRAEVIVWDEAGEPVFWHNRLALLLYVKRQPDSGCTSAELYEVVNWNWHPPVANRLTLSKDMMRAFRSFHRKLHPDQCAANGVVWQPVQLFPSGITLYEVAKQSEPMLAWDDDESLARYLMKKAGELQAEMGGCR